MVDSVISISLFIFSIIIVYIKKAEIIKEVELGNLEITRLGEEIEAKDKIKQELIYVVERRCWDSYLSK